jgi:hypothetical protein
MNRAFLCWLSGVECIEGIAGCLGRIAHIIGGMTMMKSRTEVKGKDSGGDRESALPSDFEFTRGSFRVQRNSEWRRYLFGEAVSRAGTSEVKRPIKTRTMKTFTPTLIYGSTLAICAALLLSASAGCSNTANNPVVPPPVDSTERFTGIQQTFEDGRLGGTIGDASDDWRSLAAIGFTTSAAFPNPAQAQVTYSFRISQPEEVRTWLEAAPGVLAFEITNRRFEAGDHDIQFQVGSLTPGIYRLYTSVTRDGVVHKTYGDIMVQPNPLHSSATSGSPFRPRKGVGGMGKGESGVRESRVRESADQERW